MFTGLSYPHMAPPLDWLMVQLLFYDEIKTVVPTTEISNLPEEHLRFYDAIPQTVSFVNPENENLWPSADESNRLIKGFTDIKNKLQFDFNKLNIIISKDGSSTQLKGCTFLHVGKTSPAILSALERLELMPRNSAELAEGFLYRDNWIIVEENSADLLLGHLSNNLAKRYGYYPLTYKDSPFILNSLNDINAISIPDSESLLVSKILNLEFPYEISTMSIKDYKVLRSAYADIRVPFHELINKLAEFNRIDTISSPHELNDRIRSIASDFDENYRKFKECQIIRNIRKWSPFGASSILSIVGCVVSTFPWNLALAVGSITVSAIGNVISNNRPNENTDLFNRLSKLETAILKKTDIQYLL